MKNIDRFLEKKSILIDLDIRPKDFAGKDNCVYSLNWIINCNADKVLKLRNSLHVLTNLSNKEIISKNDHLLFINNYKDLCRIDFIIKNNIKDKFVGGVNLVLTRYGWEIGKYIGDKNYEGKGIAKRSTLSIIDFFKKEFPYFDEIYAKTKETNKINIKINESLGFKITKSLSDEFVLMLKII